MSRGKKLDLSIGADLGDGWGMVEETTESKTAEILEPSKHFLVFKKEKRRGKPVTHVGPFCLEKKEAESVLKTLKKRLGCGGTYKEQWMEFQGDIQPQLRTQLEKESFRFKR